MLLKDRQTGHLVEVLNLQELINPELSEFTGRFNVGEELPDPQPFAKTRLVFCSGEALPRCWTDSHYRDAEVAHH